VDRPWVDLANRNLFPKRYAERIDVLNSLSRIEQLKISREKCTTMSKISCLLLDYAAFPVLVLAAWLEGWQPGELAWGLWISSYCMVMVWMVLMAAFLIREDGGRVFRIASTLLMIAVFGWMVTWGFRFYGDLIDFIYPLIPDPGRIDLGGGKWRNLRPFELLPTLKAGIQEFYIIILVSLYPIISGVRQTWPDTARFRTDPGFAPRAFVRLHFRVMALIGLQIAFRADPGPHIFLMSVVLLAIDSLPWHRFARRVKP